MLIWLVITGIGRLILHSLHFYGQTLGEGQFFKNPSSVFPPVAQYELKQRGDFYSFVFTQQSNHLRVYMQMKTI